MLDRNQNIINYLKCVKKHRKAINEVEQLLNELDANNFSNIAAFIEAIDQKLMAEGVEIINSILREKQNVNRYIERYVYAYKVLSVLLIIIGCLLLATSASSSLILSIALSMVLSGGFSVAFEKAIIYIFERCMGKIPEDILNELRVAISDVNKHGRNVYSQNENQEWEFLRSEVPQTYEFYQSYVYQERGTSANIGNEVQSAYSHR